jgi:hypothetical protein
MATRTKDGGNSKAKYSVETISKIVAIETESGDEIILTDPEIDAVEFVSWGDVIGLGKKLLDLISTGPTFPTPPTDGGGKGGGPIIVISGDGNHTTIIIK